MQEENLIGHLALGPMETAVMERIGHISRAKTTAVFCVTVRYGRFALLSIT
ncbi:MAG: hypothetical protein IAE79_27720 [Anaerolinea sp.]|nr:hypothetical protein [Anaerolinea sp.]